MRIAFRLGEADLDLELAIAGDDCTVGDVARAWPTALFAPMWGSWSTARSLLRRGPCPTPDCAKAAASTSPPDPRRLRPLRRLNSQSWAASPAANASA